MSTVIIFVRHGEAGPYGLAADDAKRALTARGHEQAASIARQIAEQYAVELIVTSPYLRAQQTAQPIILAFPQVPVAICEHITPDNHPAHAIDWLSKQSAKCIVVVCHMPIVSRIVALMLDGDSEPFALAEFRVLVQALLIPGLSRQIACGYPLIKE